MKNNKRLLKNNKFVSKTFTAAVKPVNNLNLLFATFKKQICLKLKLTYYIKNPKSRYQFYLD